MEKRRHCYRACGLTIRSEVEMPAAPIANQPADDAVEIRFGRAPEQLTGAGTYGAAYEAAEGQLLLKVPEVGRYWVRDGREIIIDPDPGAPESEIRIFLLGSAFGAILHQRGVLPLHASTVRVGDGCVAFAGFSGAGKSTLAAFLQQRGYQVIGDDICPVRVLPGVGAVAFPAFDRLKLWSDALKALGSDPAEHRQMRSGVEKYEVAFDRPADEEFFPLRCVYWLSEARCQDPEGIEPVERSSFLKVLVRNTYRFRYLEGFGTTDDHFRVCARVLSSTSVFHLRRFLGLDRLAETVDWLEDHWKELGGTAGGQRAAA